MTREEAIAIIENEKECVNRDCNRDCYNCELVKTDTEILTALDMAIKALEQSPILDKVIAEIMDTGAYEQEVKGNTEFLKGINYCLGVIDKYMVESEDKE